MLESELFGHERARLRAPGSRRIWKIEEADWASTRCCWMEIQRGWICGFRPNCCGFAKERAFDRVGGSKPIPVDIRILATSQSGFEKAVG